MNHKLNKTILLFILSIVSIVSLISIACKAETITPTPVQIPTNIPTETEIVIVYPPTVTENFDNRIAQVVNCNYLNIRVLPNSDSIIVTSVPVGTELKVLKEIVVSVGNVWYQIEYTENNTKVTGYVNGEYIKFIR